MCGIFGFITDKPSKTNVELFKDICQVSSVRGTDSTGIAFVTPKNKIVIDKAPIPADKYLETKLPELEKDLLKAHIVIGHTRNWTQGKPSDNNNNHPVLSDKWVMVHNGMCSSMPRINNYKYHGEVDSEILLSHIETQGLEKGLINLKGYAAIALLHNKNPQTIHLWRHNEPLWVGYDKESATIFFGSTENIMETALANVFTLFTTFQIREIDEDTLYLLKHSPLNLEAVMEIEPKGWTYCSTGSSGYGDWSSDPEWWRKRYPNNRTKQIPLKPPGKEGWKWNVQKQLYIPTESSIDNKNEDNSQSISNKFYFTKVHPSMDFSNWERIDKNGRRYYLSVDKTLVKIWDKAKEAHFIMTMEDALKEDLVIKEGL